MLKIRLLGQYSVQLDSAPIEIQTRPAKTLLAYLLLTLGTHHPRERLAGLLWPDSDEANARKNLRQALWRLRKSIGENYLMADTATVAFNSKSEFWLDTVELENSRPQDLERVVSLYEGDLLPGFYEDWVLLERDRLIAVFEREMQRLLTQLMQEERWTDARDWAERWIAQGQIPEAAYRALMVSYAASGEPAKVEVVYRRCVEALQQDIGVDPSTETKELYEALISGASDFGYPFEEEAYPHKARRYYLPAQTTAFIGREQELEQTEQLLATNRLLTLTGPGGIGKTRLALRVAVDMLDQFKDGAYFVNLATIDVDGHITQTIADALEFPLSTQAEPDDQLLRYLRNRQLILVMDNFEHLLEGVSLVSRILQAASGVKILATSREKLELQGEAAFAVAGMSFPSSSQSDDLLHHDAIELFVQSAQRALPGFEPSASDLEHVRQICYMVEGMPLAIELAAAWLDTLSLKEIEDELRRSLDILSTEMRDVPDRHRNIRAAFDHSWSLINKTEQEVFIRFSVFRGGFTRDAAQHVADASLDRLAALVGKSFVRHDSSTGRFEIHELMRQYAEEKLEEDSQASLSVHEAHASYYADFMDKRWEYLRDDRQMIALDEIDVDIENVRKAWRYSTSNADTTRMRSFIQSIRLVYSVRGWNYAGMELFAEAVKAVETKAENEEAEALGAMALAHQGFFMAWLGLAERGIELARQGADVLRRLNRQVDLVHALNALTLCAQYLDLHDEQEQAAREMVQIANELEDKWLEAFSLFPLSTSRFQQHDYIGAQELAEQSLKISEEIGDSIISIYDLLVLGHVASNLEEYVKARAYYLRSLNMSEKVGYRWAIENSSKYLGNVAIAMDEIDMAGAYFSMSMRIAEEIGLGRDMVNLLYEFARVRVAQGRIEPAVELLTLVLKHPASRQARFGEGLIQDTAQDLLDELAEDIPKEAYAEAVARGKALELEEVVARLIEKEKLVA